MNARSKDIAVVPAMSVTERASQALSKAETETEILALVEKSKPIVAVTDSTSREFCHESLMTLKTLRVQIEKRGKEGREEATRYSKAVIAIEKELVGLLTPEETRLAKLRDDFDNALKAEKERLIRAEQERVKIMQERIEELRGCQTLTPASGSKLIAEHILDLEAIAIDDSFEEFKDRADSVKLVALTRLNALHAAARTHEGAQLKLEEERAELARQRAEQAERESREKAAREAEARSLAEARARQEAEDKARHAAEAARLKAEREENERLARERQAELDAAAAKIEADRLQVERDRDALIVAQKPVESPKPDHFYDPADEAARDKTLKAIASISAAPTPEPNLSFDPESYALAEHFLSGIIAATDWHKKSLAQAIQMAVEDWFEDFRKEDPEDTEEDTSDVPW